MFERVIFDVLTEGISTFRQRREYIERLFRHDGLDRSEAAKIRDLFQRLPPTVIHNYPRDDSNFPLYAIVLGEEQESLKFLEDSGGLLGEDDDLALLTPSAVGNMTRTSIYTSMYHIYTATDAPDVTLAYYHILRNMLTLRRPKLIAAGAAEVRFSGSDITPELRYLPAYLFCRRLTVACQLEVHAVEGRAEPKEGPIRSVRGIHINDGFTTTEALGGVPAYVEPYVDIDEEET